MRMFIRIAAAISFSMMFLVAHVTSNAASAEPKTSNIIFREPFTHKFLIDKESIYEERIDEKIPYVDNNNVHLFYGDSFGLKLAIENGEISTVTYQKDKTGADIEVEFKQKDLDNEKLITMLMLKSNIQQVLYMNALMTVPNRKGIYETSILPLQPGLMGFEAWPHPIVQLVLTNLRVKETAPNNTPAKN